MRIGQRKVIRDIAARLRSVLGLHLVADEITRALSSTRTWYVYWETRGNFMRAQVHDPCKRKLHPILRREVRWSGRAACAAEAFAMEQRRQEHRKVRV